MILKGDNIRGGDAVKPGTKIEGRKGNYTEKITFTLNPRSSNRPDTQNYPPKDLLSDRVTTMRGPSNTTQFQDLKILLKDPRDSLLESLEQEEDQHERNLKMLFRATCGPIKNISPKKEVNLPSKDQECLRDQGVSADFSPTSTLYSGKKKSFTLKHQHQEPVIRSFQIQPHYRLQYDSNNVGKQTQQMQLEIKRALQIAANQRRAERNNQNVYDTQHLPQIDNLNSTTGLLDVIRSNRQKSYQQSMQKLKDLELKQHTTLGFLKNQVRTTAAVATKAIIQYQQQQQQSSSQLQGVKDNNKKTILVSRVGSDQSHHTILKLNTKQPVPKYELVVSQGMSPNTVSNMHVKTPVKHPPQPASQINVFQTQSNLMIHPMAQTNRETLFQIEQRKRAFEDQVAQMQQIKHFYATNGKSPREQRYHLVIPTVNVSPENFGPSRQSNGSFVLNDASCHITENIIPTPASIQTVTSPVNGNISPIQDQTPDLKYQLKVNLLTNRKSKPLFQSSNMPLISSASIPDQTIHQKDFQQFKYANN